jgi:hypothetical protein
MQKRISLIAVCTILLIGALGSFRVQSNKAENMAMNGQSESGASKQKTSEKKPIFACNMLALNAQKRKRHLEVTKQVRAITKEERELSDGYGFRFPSDQSNILLVSEFIARERICCPFFSFEMVVEPEDGPLWVRLRGAEGVKDFIRAEFGMK